MRNALVAVLCVGCSVGCSSPTTESAPDAADLEASSDVGNAASDTPTPPRDTDGPADTAATDTSTTTPGEKFHSDLMFVGTGADRSAWICLHVFVSSDVKSATPFSSLGPIGATGDGTDPGPLTFGRAVRATGTSDTDAAFGALTVVVAAQATKPTSCKDSWPAVAPSTNDWVLVPPKTIRHGFDAAFTFGDEVRVYEVDDAKVVPGAYVAQLINESSDAASFAIQPRDESGAAIGGPVPLAGGKIASHAIGTATPLSLPTTGAFAASDLVVDSTPLSLFGPSLARLAWAKEDGAGSLVVFAGTAAAPTIVLVPWN